MPNTPTGLLENANSAQVTLRGGASLTDTDGLADIEWSIGVTALGWSAGEVKV